jgi:hypothetical protein
VKSEKMSAYLKKPKQSDNETLQIIWNSLVDEIIILLNFLNSLVVGISVVAAKTSIVLNLFYDNLVNSLVD